MWDTQPWIPDQTAEDNIIVLPKALVVASTDHALHPVLTTTERNTAE